MVLRVRRFRQCTSSYSGLYIAIISTCCLIRLFGTVSIQLCTQHYLLPCDAQAAARDANLHAPSEYENSTEEVLPRSLLKSQLKQQLLPLFAKVEHPAKLDYELIASIFFVFYRSYLSVKPPHTELLRWLLLQFRCNYASAEPQGDPVSFHQTSRRPTPQRVASTLVSYHLSAAIFANTIHGRLSEPT